MTKSVLNNAAIQKRHRAETRFRVAGLSTVIFVMLVLVFFLSGIVFYGYSAFMKTEISVKVPFSAALWQNVSPPTSEKIWQSIIQENFPNAQKMENAQEFGELFSQGAVTKIISFARENPKVIGTTQQIWLKASDHVDRWWKTLRSQQTQVVQLNEDQVGWLIQLTNQNKIEQQFNKQFFLTADSREPEQVGILGALMGSFYVIVVTLLLAFPVGIFAAIYLEEFSPDNGFTRFIEVNISNLAAVPSIIFGLLGLAIFLNFFDLPRSSSLVGGMTLALMTLPTIVIAGRAAIRTIPDSIRNAARGLGASSIQVTFHHVLPLAMPGILTGTILGVARALGESAPLFMIGMVAFVVDVPSSPLDPATTLPVQIYMWASNPEQGFIENTAAAIIILLAFLIVMNMAAIIVRKKSEHRW